MGQRGSALCCTRANGGTRPMPAGAADRNRLMERHGPCCGHCTGADGVLAGSRAELCTCERLSAASYPHSRRAYALAIHMLIAVACVRSRPCSRMRSPTRLMPGVQGSENAGEEPADVTIDLFSRAGMTGFDRQEELEGPAWRLELGQTRCDSCCRMRTYVR